MTKSQRNGMLLDQTIATLCNTEYIDDWEIYLVLDRVASPREEAEDKVFWSAYSDILQSLLEEQLLAGEKGNYHLTAQGQSWVRDFSQHHL